MLWLELSAIRHSVTVTDTFMFGIDFFDFFRQPLTKSG